MDASGRRRVERAVAEILDAAGADTAAVQLRDTPVKVADAVAELFAGIGRDPVAALQPTLAAESSDLVLVRDLRFRSVCAHQLLPFFGSAQVAYLPGKRIAGLGRLPAMIDILASRPQVQEQLTAQIADAIVQGLAALGVWVMLECRQLCLSARGPRQEDAGVVTVAARGELDDSSRRAELAALLGRSTMNQRGASRP